MSADRPDDDWVIRLSQVGKCHAIFAKPEDRLKQLFAFGRRRYYQEYWSVRDVSFEIKRGESVGLIGLNGAGKSTLLKMICGTLRPSTGKIEIKGRVAPMLELGAGFNPEFTGAENIRLAASVLGLADDLIEQRYASIIAFAEIGDFIDQPVKSYSSGMYTRLAFAVAAHVDADILIADEILSVGDAAFQQKCMRFIHGFREHGTLLLVSHSPQVVTTLCDRAVWMETGSVRAIGSAKDVSLDYFASLRGASENLNAFKIGGSRKPPPARIAAATTMDDQTTPGDPVRTRCVVETVVLEDAAGSRITVVAGGQSVVLRVGIRADNETPNPTVLFECRDRLGVLLFCGETDRSDMADFSASSWNEVSFTLEMPRLPAGDFALSVAVMTPSGGNWITEDYRRDICFFSVASQASFGLIGADTRGVELHLGPDRA